MMHTPGPKRTHHVPDPSGHPRSGLSARTGTRLLVLPALLGLSLVLFAQDPREEALDVLRGRAQGVLAGSPHDFRYPGTLQGGGDRAPDCAVCHRDPGLGLRSSLWDAGQEPESRMLDHTGALCLACHDQRLAPGFGPAGLCSAATPFGIEEPSPKGPDGSFHAHAWPSHRAWTVPAMPLKVPARQAATRPVRRRSGQGVDCLTCHNAHDNSNGATSCA
jgi:hypothetical protein